MMTRHAFVLAGFEMMTRHPFEMMTRHAFVLAGFSISLGDNFQEPCLAHIMAVLMVWWFSRSHHGHGLMVLARGHDLLPRA